MMRCSPATPLLLLALSVAACGDEESDLTAEQQAVLQSLSESIPAWVEESPGAEGPAADLTASSTGVGLAFAPGDSFHRPAFWGRLRRADPPNRSRIVVIEGDTAQVHLAVRFNGILKVDTTFDGIANAGSKPLHETAHQFARFVRDTAASRGWRLVGISPRRFQNTRAEEQTVNISSVSIARNSDAPLVVTDPATLFTPGSLTSTIAGDTLTVVVQVTNTSGTDLVPPTQLFIHVRHLDPGHDHWGRFPMQRQEDGSFRAKWVVRRPGAAIIGVDALDSQSLTTQSGDDYRSDLWAVPVFVDE